MQKSSFSIENTLSNLQIETLNEMQQASLVANKTSNDVVLLADTGSGKTLAFLLPVTQLLERNSQVTQALIIVPSRELALQIEVKDFFSFVAVRKSQASHTLQMIKTEKIKNKKVKIDVAK